MRFVPQLVNLVVVLSLVMFGVAADVSRAQDPRQDPCSEAALRELLLSDADTLELHPGCFYMLTANLPNISRDVRIIGNGATIDGADQFRLLSTVGAVRLTLEDLTLQHAYWGNGAALYMPGGTLTIQGVTFRRNRALGEGGAVWVNMGSMHVIDSTFEGNSADSGGAIYMNAGSVEIRGSLFTGNRAVNGEGGATYTYDAGLDIQRSSFVSNSSFGRGGGAIWTSGREVTLHTVVIADNLTEFDEFARLFYGGAVTATSQDIVVRYSTITGNQQRGESLDPPGGALTVLEYVGSTVTAYATLFADNAPYSLAPEAMFISQGYNLFDEGEPQEVAATDVVGVDPLFVDALVGGSPLLSTNSPARDAIPSTECEPDPLDIRGMARPQGSGCDIGAVEMETLEGHSVNASDG
jgi:predicted outer membrane repeat protein